MPHPTSARHTPRAALLKVATPCSSNAHKTRDPYTSYPPSTPFHDSDSDDNPTPSFTTTIRLRASIAAVPETRLREIMVKLVDRSPGFQHAVAKELLSLAPPPAPSSPRRKRRRSPRRLDVSAPQRTCVNCSHAFAPDKMHHEDAECTFHPGRLEREVYEFPSWTPEGRCFKVLRTITMWSCCDEDAVSAGCVSVPAHVDSQRGVIRASQRPLPMSVA